jgi:hypothetical protein
VEQEKKVVPLSEKPQGYLLAIAGGSIGGPIGMLLSPIVLVILNNRLKAKEDKVPNRFAIWALIGIVGVPLSLSPFMGGETNPSSGQKIESQKIEREAEKPKEAPKPVQKNKIDTFAFTTKDYIERLNTSFSFVQTEAPLQAIVTNTEAKDDRVNTQATVGDAVAYVITSDKQSGKVIDLMMIGAGTGSIQSGADIIISMIATVMAIENPNMGDEERRKISNQLGVLSTSGLQKDVKFVRNDVRYSKSFSEGVGMFLTADRVKEGS